MTTTSSTRRNGGQILIDQLRIHGARRVFSVPGESFLPAIDALHDAREAIQLVTCRQEGAAAHMAEAHGKLTGEPGICFVTRGPGATNASIGVHTARQDSTPMILLVGLVGRHVARREAWQEIDVEAVFGSLAKWAVRIDRIERIPELVARAFQVATSGRGGPVVIGLPEDLLYEEAEVEDAVRYQRVHASPSPSDMQRLRELLATAERPFVLLGGGGWSRAACDAIRSFAAAFDLPVGTAFRRQDLLDNRDVHFAGDVGIGVNPALAERIRGADLIVSVGARMGETTTNDYTLLKVPKPTQTLVHVHPDPNELGSVYQADLMINAGMREFAEAAQRLEPVPTTAWRGWTRAARADYLATLEHGPMPGELNMGDVMAQLRQRLPADTIVTNGAGNYTSWVHRFYQYGGFRTELAPTSGTMGYGTPAAIAAALEHPGRTVVCFAGDGCFQMTPQELATVQQYGLGILFVIVNNGIYGSIRMHQEVHYPGKVYGTDIENPDFPALAAAYGLHGEAVQRTEDFGNALERALHAPGAALLELRIDPEAITPRTTLTALREKALEARGAG
ncbi:thiamine pyrophosphate-binding protein [Piscinibacter koreensis]|uniref:Thiamine pyrophosphate-binding protein n=1 Tax=Piscinibacter koreensis TaxID=2742824 RepID=A0A7Y6TVL8_9BURK|nr:thiamine pyrophosphate-binding protein [Schlegelella koreensis]NUZ05057.1 thiamine pyrophosphate-binding protein [Schlegelella koreensis]